MRVDEVGSPAEVRSLDVVGSETDFNTISLHACNVTELINLTAYTLCGSNADKVVVVTLVPIHFKVDAVVEETCRQSEVKLVLLLVCEFLVCKVLDVEHTFTNTCERTPRGLATDFYDSV